MWSYSEGETPSHPPPRLILAQFLASIASAWPWTHPFALVRRHQTFTEEHTQPVVCQPQRHSGIAHIWPLTEPSGSPFTAVHRDDHHPRCRLYKLSPEQLQMNVLTAVLTFSLAHFPFLSSSRLQSGLSFWPSHFRHFLSLPTSLPCAHSAQAHGQAPFYLECTLLCSPLDDSRHPVSLSIETEP